VNIPTAHRTIALVGILFCLAAQSRSAGELDTGFVLSCGPTPAVPCAQSYWNSARSLAASDVQQYETHYNSWYFQTWCDTNPDSCIAWLFQWAEADAGSQYAVEISNYWNSL